MPNPFNWFSSKFNELLNKNRTFETIVGNTFGPSKVVVYNAKGKPIDVRGTLKILGSGESFPKQALVDAGIKPTDDNDSKVCKIRDYVNSRLTYVSDQANYGLSEYWADPYTVWSKKKGDCDDYAILIMTLMNLAGIPSWKRRIVAGTVSTGEGHACVVYFTDLNNMWCVVEGSYYANDAKNKFNIVPYTSNDRYIDVWFSFNEDQAWSKNKKVFINDFLG